MTQQSPAAAALIAAAERREAERQAQTPHPHRQNGGYTGGV